MIRKLKYSLRIKLSALFALLSLCVAILPRLPLTQDCCETTDKRPSCCPPIQKEGDPTQQAKSTCCQHLPFEALTTSVIVTKAFQELKAPVWILPTLYVPVIFEEWVVVAPVARIDCPQTGPPSSIPLYLYKETFLI
jgi:hypothetical protein